LFYESRRRQNKDDGHDTAGTAGTDEEGGKKRIIRVLFPQCRTFAAGNKIKQFYELLVEDSLRREDVDTMSRENMRNLHELMQSFRFSNVCFWSYLSRTW